MIIVHAHLQVQPDQEQLFSEEIQALVQETRKEAGNISFELMKSTEHANRYTVVELWKDLNALLAHAASEHYTAFSQEATTFMAAPIELKVFDGEAVQV